MNMRAGSSAPENGKIAALMKWSRAPRWQFVAQAA